MEATARGVAVNQVARCGVAIPTGPDEDVEPAGVEAPEALAPDLADALAILDAHRLVHVGLRRCEGRVQVLTRGGAVSGGDRSADRCLDRALHDRLLLGAMRGELASALVQMRQRMRRSVVEQLIAPVPLARLQHDVLVDRVCGASWPRIAALWTHGDRGSAVRAFRQAAVRVKATAAVLEALRSRPGDDAAEIARRTGLTVRMVHRIWRHLAGRQAGPSPDRGLEAALPSDGPKPPGVGPRRTAIPIRPKGANRPNPNPPAKPCPGGQAEGEPVAWRVLQVRPGFELQVKVGVERRLGDRVRCRTLRTEPGQRAAIGYLAVSCSDPGALRDVLADLPGVVGWVAGTSRAAGRRAWVQESVPDRAVDVAASWLDPRRVHP